MSFIVEQNPIFTANLMYCYRYSYKHQSTSWFSINRSKYNCTMYSKIQQLAQFTCTYDMIMGLGEAIDSV